MSKKPRWTSDQIKNSGLVETNEGFVKSEKLVDKKPKKLPSLIERAIPFLDEMDKITIKKQEIINKGNPRVKNAKKTEAYGIVFDSKLECYMYGLLENAGIKFEHQKVFVVQDKFNYNGEHIRAIKCVIDFWLPRQFMIIDSKGFHTDVSKLKYKLLKKYLFLNDTYWENGSVKILKQPKIEMPKNKAECDILINKILYGN